MAKNLILINIECQKEETLDIIASFKDVKGEIKFFSVEEITPDKKVGF